jgi:uroporphyrinogen decarboxylase
MTSRERLLTAIENKRPDRLPCQVHGWMPYYLEHYLGGIDQWAAYEKFDMDYVIYLPVDFTFDHKDLANWQLSKTEVFTRADGTREWWESITTPKGILHRKCAATAITEFTLEPFIKNEADFDIWNKYCPVPTGVDLTRLKEAKERLKDKGIIRTYPMYYPGQGSPWQAFCFAVGTEPAIIWAIDKPDWVHYILEELLKKSLRAIELQDGNPGDIVEVGGGAASNTVISPAMFKEFCLPYDKRQNESLHSMGFKIVYHLCGGLMKMAELVVETGADGLETMTPPSMGGDCDLRKISQQLGDKLFFIGGFDQNAGFENGSPEITRKQVLECFEATKDYAGYIISPSDHFFQGSPDNIKAFVNAAKECIY